MGFWTNLFFKTKVVEDSRVIKRTAVSNEVVKDNQEPTIDDNGWLTYSNGIKLKINYENPYTPTEIFEELGYEQYELYVSHHCENRKVYPDVKSSVVNVDCYWELFSNELVFITRPDDRIMTTDDINRCIRCQRKHIKEQSEIPGLDSEAMFCLENGIKEQGIRQSFIEKCFNKKCENNRLSARRFFFLFQNNYLSNCFYDGYALNTWTTFSVGLEIDEYYNVIKQLIGWTDKRIKKLIDKQAEYFSKIDSDILHSIPTLNLFSYSRDSICSINYIGLAAVYQQYDVSQDLFLESTLGNYVLLSKSTINGITTTKIRAYNNTIIFHNGHSLLEQSISKEQISSPEQNDESDSTEGFIYVAINPSFGGMVKIGKTTRDPDERVKELSSATGIPTPFILIFYKHFRNCHFAEKMIHQALEKQGFRVNDNREFFKMSSTDAIQIIQNYYDKVELGESEYSD